MAADGVVFMGAALNKKHDLTKARRKTPWIHSYWSRNDERADDVDGAGSTGFDKVPKDVIEHQVDEMRHSSGIGRQADIDVAAKRPAKGKTLPFVSYYMGREYVHKVLALTKPPVCSSGEKPEPKMRGYTTGIVVRESGVE